MEKLEKFYNMVIQIITHCVEQDFIPEDEEDYIIDCINEAKEKVINNE